MTVPVASYPCQNLTVPFFLKYVILVGCSIAYGFICISLVTINLENLFMDLFAFWKSFVKCLFVYFAHFLKF